MKSFRHRVECRSSEGALLGAAEFKTLRRWPSELALRDELLQRLKAVVKPEREHRLTFTLNQRWGADDGPRGCKVERPSRVAAHKPSARMAAPALEAQPS